jgi:hypothetical protein
MKQNTQERIAEFFESHPDATECFEALGKVFSEKDKAEKYLAGVAGRFVTTHSREGQSFERESDRLKFEMGEQENVINEKQLAFENAGGMDKQPAMGEWDAAKKKLTQLQSRYEKQLSLEEKEELLAKDDKEIVMPVVKKEATVEELQTAVNNQQQIVDSNAKLIKKMPDGKKKKNAEKAQLAEVKKLKALEDELKTAQEKAAVLPATGEADQGTDNAGETNLQQTDNEENLPPADDAGEGLE